MCCSDPPPPPDLSMFGDAMMEMATSQREIAEQQLAWAREQDTLNRETLGRVLDVQLPAMEDQARFAREDRQRYEDTFRPLEDQFIQEAQEYDTPQRREQERSRAMADVAGGFDAARRNALQRLESYGVDPSMTRNAALDLGARTAQAAAQVGAASAADQRVENTGRALRADAMNMGRGLPAQAAQGFAGATGTGSAAIGGANQTTGTSASAAQGAGSYLSGAMQGIGGAAGIAQQGYDNQMGQWNAQQQQRAGTLQAVGQGVGMAMFMNDGGKARALPFQDDGPVATGMGDGSGIDDTVPAYLSDGEYVIPADVVKAKGTEFFDKLVERYHTPAAQQRGAI